MKRTHITRFLGWLTCLVLAVTVAALAFHSTAHASKNGQAKADKVASDLRDKKNGAKSREEMVTVILQLSGPASPQLNAFLNQNGVHLRKQFQNFATSVVELPLDALDELEAFDEVSYISLDSELKAMAANCGVKT